MIRIFLACVALVIFIYGLLVALAPDPLPDVTNPTATSTVATTSAATVVAQNLTIPWDIAFLPDNTLLVTERDGNVVHLDPTSGSQRSIPVSAKTSGESGLLGIALHPDFERNAYVYLYMSTKIGAKTINKVVRYTYANETLTVDKEIIGNIPGATYHDGGRMEFGPDGKLYITTGDATTPAIAQDTTSRGGKILRLNDDGSVPSDNPFGNAVWTFGHRNPQGLAWDDSGALWETEHGPTGERGRCCHDEINKLTKGGNYGWPTIIGSEQGTSLTQPAWHSGDDTWAPASLVYFDGSLYFGGLIGESLYEARIENGTVTDISSHLTGIYGRIRTIRVGPDGMFYITTSNTDGRGSPIESDDRIIRIDPASLH